ncbi:hypothetical protein QCA50_009046 [Cerrena zonata]|uniref:Uncharacterized protein n=1 Tax=Cerrena zonata TaxID=2478898 RepID=A0AAW0G8G6_9APHY
MQSLPIIGKGLAASLKYEIDRATQFLKEDLRLLGTTNPMWMYMHACQLHLETEAQSAAQLLQKKYYPAGHSDPPSTDADFARIATELYSDDCGQLPAIDLYSLLRHICFGDDLPLSSISTKQEPLDEQYHDRMLALEFPKSMEDLPADVLAAILRWYHDPHTQSRSSSHVGHGHSITS